MPFQAVLAKKTREFNEKEYVSCTIRSGESTWKAVQELAKQMAGQGVDEKKLETITYNLLEKGEVFIVRAGSKKISKNYRKVFAGDRVYCKRSVLRKEVGVREIAKITKARIVKREVQLRERVEPKKSRALPGPYYGKMEELKHFTFANADKAKKRYWTYVLGDACQTGKLYRAEDAIFEGAEIDAPDERGWTPLMHAVANKHNKIVILLLENMAKADEKILLFAQKHGNNDAVKMIILRQKRDEIAKRAEESRKEFYQGMVAEQKETVEKELKVRLHPKLRNRPENMAVIGFIKESKNVQYYLGGKPNSKHTDCTGSVIRFCHFLNKEGLLSFDAKKFFEDKRHRHSGWLVEDFYKMSPSIGREYVVLENSGLGNIGEGTYVSMPGKKEAEIRVEKIIFKSAGKMVFFANNGGKYVAEEWGGNVSIGGEYEWNFGKDSFFEDKKDCPIFAGNLIKEGHLKGKNGLYFSYNHYPKKKMNERHLGIYYGRLHNYSNPVEIGKEGEMLAKELSGLFTAVPKSAKVRRVGENKFKITWNAENIRLHEGKKGNFEFEANFAVDFEKEKAVFEKYAYKLNKNGERSGEARGPQKITFDIAKEGSRYWIIFDSPVYVENTRNDDPTHYLDLETKGSAGRMETNGGTLQLYALGEGCDWDHPRAKYWRGEWGKNLNEGHILVGPINIEPKVMIAGAGVMKPEGAGG
ncbi:MAG: ankyrin repeat domain-containing protein [Candidatus Micrarchaeota archaeon]